MVRIKEELVCQHLCSSLPTPSTYLAASGSLKIGREKSNTLSLLWSKIMIFSSNGSVTFSVKTKTKIRNFYNLHLSMKGKLNLLKIKKAKRKSNLRVVLLHFRPEIVFKEISFLRPSEPALFPSLIVIEWLILNFFFVGSYKQRKPKFEFEFLPVKPQNSIPCAL